MDSWKAIVEGEGLVFVGVAPLDRGQDYARFEQWLAKGYHGTMDFLERSRDLRREPERLLPGARAVVVVGLPYDQGDPLEGAGPRVAQYARFRDYHWVLWRRGERVAAALERLHPESRNRVVADSAPLLERSFAAATGSGFIGKNTCYIDPDRGSFLLLGEILTTLEVDATDRSVDPRQRDAKGGCGTCNLCQVHCPTGALAEDYSIDATRCLSYWTIEHRGTIPESYWPHFSRYWFGCDLCQLACPYTRRVSGWALPKELEPRSLPPLADVAMMDQKQYEFWFGGTPMTRARKEGLRRNALIALAVTRDGRLGEVMKAWEGETDPVLQQTRDQVERWLRRPSADNG